MYGHQAKVENKLLPDAEDQTQEVIYFVHICISTFNVYSYISIEREMHVHILVT